MKIAGTDLLVSVEKPPALPPEDSPDFPALGLGRVIQLGAALAAAEPADDTLELRIGPPDPAEYLAEYAKTLLREARRAHDAQLACVAPGALVLFDGGTARRVPLDGFESCLLIDIHSVVATVEGV